jgi:glycosyltransferase involved in cell wall biosynthesis
VGESRGYGPVIPPLRMPFRCTAAEWDRLISATTQPAPKLLYYVTEDWYFVSHRLALAVAAKAAGYEVCVATRVRAHGDGIRGAGLRLIPFENSRSNLNPFKELWTVLRLIHLYRHERPDVVHHVAIKPVMYGSIAARLAGSPRVVNAFGGLGWLFSSGALTARAMKPAIRWWLRRLLRSGTALVQNPDDARLLVQMGVPDSNIRLIPGSGVDLDRFRPRPESAALPTVVLPARLIWEKGVGQFVEAARILREQGIGARFVLAGEPDRENPSAVPAECILEWVRAGLIEHLGWVEDMPELLGESHVVCLPSFYGEGIPKSLIEAAAAGRAIVTTDTPGCREIVHHEENGLLVPPRDARALSEALARLIGDPELRQRMGNRGRVRAVQEFGIARVIDQTLAIYAEAGRNRP